MMKPGEKVEIQAVVLRVEGERLDAQTADGQLLQTNVSNVVGHKAVLNASETKQVHRRKNR